MKARVDQKWMCVNIENGKVSLVDYTTLRWTRKESIARILSGSPVYSWKQYRSFGWRCIKVHISFELKEVKFSHLGSTPKQRVVNYLKSLKTT